ncbi:Alpha/Beta hydrolase protein [Scheffersomyces amazonensis]|uniref:Alpha/Beta hydrolase protein n=1 Tax=Scheffersomyces amazonensis TaxID=1078765 RepID=UPI00315DF585
MIVARINIVSSILKTKRTFTTSSLLLQFQLPSTYKAQHKLITSISIKQGWKIWKRSLKPQRLQEVQNELVDLMINSRDSSNANVIIEKKQITIDNENTVINEVNFRIINNEKYPTKHIVFIHGYGASLGCFARNFQVINKFEGKDKNFNYSVHFLDNITFGLSSNPKIPDETSRSINHWIIPKCPEVKITPGRDEKLYNKYYKLVDKYEVNVPEFREYQNKFKPVLKDLEDFYTSAIDKWRNASEIDQIDYLVGHSYGGYWSGSYSLVYPSKLKNLILLSPVGVERHVHAVTNNLFDDSKQIQVFKPTINPISYNFLTRLPILSKKHVTEWYYKLPFLPRLLKWFGPFGAQIYFKMWLGKLFKINKLILKFGGPEKVFQSNNDLPYGSRKECFLIVEYLYNAIIRGSNSDIYIKHLLTPATVSKYPLYDKFENYLVKDGKSLPFNVTLVYGQYDFMNSEAGQELKKLIEQTSKDNGNDINVSFHKIAEGGHNLYIDNPFDTNQLIYDIVEGKEKSSSEVYGR